MEGTPGAPAGPPDATARRRRPGWNLSAALLDDAGHDPELPALRFAGGEWSRGDLAERVAQTAGWLVERGVGPGTSLLVATHDSPEWVALFLAAARVGARSALASPATHPDVLAGAAARAEPDLVVTDVEPPLPGVATVGPDELRAATACGLPDPGPAPVSRADDLYMLLTSGSTGPPKWAVHRHGDIPSCIATYGRRVLRLRPGDVTFSTAALCSSYGLGNGLYFPLGAGACAWIEQGERSPAATARACREAGVTALFGVPTGWARLARHASEGRIAARDLAGVRLAVSAGEALPAGVWHQVRRALGLRLVNALGSSEATNLYLSDRPGAPRAGTVGWPVPGFSLRIASDGELLVRGPTVMRGYLGDPDASARALAGGWLHTGDLVARGADDGYEFRGRRGDAIKVGALWVDPGRVAEALERHPRVAHAAAIGVPDASGVVRLAAVVASAEGEDRLLAELEALLGEALADHERPRVIVVVEELPMTASGKLDRGAVRRMAGDELARGAGSGAR